MNGNICKLKALMCIDPVTNLVELIQIRNKTMGHVAEKIENFWLSRYLRPNRCVHNNEKEFVGSKLLPLLVKIGIKDICTTV